MERITVTADNLQEAREGCAALDQARALEPGCITWGILYGIGAQLGQITVWPNGRAAVAMGGDSDWDEWDSRGERVILDDCDDDGAVCIVTADGRQL